MQSAFGVSCWCCANNVHTPQPGRLPPFQTTNHTTKQPNNRATTTPTHRHVKEADKDIIAHIKAAGRLVDHSRLMHSYPFCWRSDTPLIYRAVPSWFVKVGVLVMV